jgi:hypothetical protein
MEIAIRMLDSGDSRHVNFMPNVEGAIKNINLLAGLYKGTKFYAIDSTGRIFAEAIVTRKGE